MTWLTQHRFVFMATGLAVVGALVGFWWVVLRSPGTPVGLRQAVRIYRQSQGQSQAPSPRPERADPPGDAVVPPSGVYQYRTTGGEQLSIGISRAFPSQSEMIVSGGSCSTMTWEPLLEHTEGLVVCPGSRGSLAVTDFVSHEVIAGTTTTETVTCPAGTLFLPAGPIAGTRWTAQCHAPGESVAMTGQVLGTGTVTVGTKHVPAIHTRLSLTFSGATSGTNPSDYWISMNHGIDGLILSQREQVDMSQSNGPIGGVRYTEEMAIDLASLEPVR